VEHGCRAHSSTWPWQQIIRKSTPAWQCRLKEVRPDRPVGWGVVSESSSPSTGLGPSTHPPEPPPATACGRRRLLSAACCPRSAQSLRLAKLAATVKASSTLPTSGPVPCKGAGAGMQNRASQLQFFPRATAWQQQWGGMETWLHSHAGKLCGARQWRHTGAAPTCALVGLPPPLPPRGPSACLTHSPAQAARHGHRVS
jgi:hypothetical protein